MARRATFSCSLTFEALEPRTLLSGLVNPSSSVFVRFNAATSTAQVAADLKAVKAQVVASYPEGPDLISLAPTEAQAAAVKALESDPGVVYAEPNGTFHATGIAASASALPPTPSGPFTPNDPALSSEWGMGMIDAPYAWAITKGSPSTIVAVLDTGIDLSNPEFAGRIWTNPAVNNDGYKGDLHGWNFVNNTGNVSDNEVDGHGTHVAGILGAAGNNGDAIAGVDWGTQIMPLKILDSQGNGTTSSAVAAVYFAVAHGARIINASWGGDSFSQAMLDALNYADSKGVVFVTAAGNDAIDEDSALANPQNATTYPASYRTPNELVVAAVNQSGNLASFSDYGPASVDLAAPGVGIVSTVPTYVSPGGLASYDGTSMATAFVSGTVALLAGINPGMNAEALVQRVRATVKPFASLNGLLISPGVVDPLNALLDRTPLTSSGVSATSTPTQTPLLTVENQLLSTAAVYSLYGGTAAGFVNGAYEAIDGRAPTGAELSYYTATLQAGEPRSDLVSKLQNSFEGDLTRVARWYIDDLGATQPLALLKSDPGVNNAAHLLASGASASAVIGQLFTNVMTSVGPTVATPTWALNFLYQGLLDRAPDPVGLNQFVAKLNAGTSIAQVADQILASTEGHRATIADLYRDELGSTATIAALEADPGVDNWASLLGTD